MFFVFCVSDDKVSVLSVLVNQLLTFAACRDHIEECSEKLKQAQRELKAHQARELRRERDETQYWYCRTFCRVYHNTIIIITIIIKPPVL